MVFELFTKTELWARRDYLRHSKTAVFASKRPEITQTEVPITSSIVYDLIKTICEVLRVTMLNLEPVREREGAQNQSRSLIFRIFGILIDLESSKLKFLLHLR